MPRRPLRSLSERRDFEKVFRQGEKSSLRHLVIYTRPNDLSAARLGLAVSRKIGKAVVRNRIRRLFKEAMRTCAGDNIAGRDFVLVAKKSSVDATFSELCGEIRSFMYGLTDGKDTDTAHKIV
jgi:ribonuclease P protein component